MKNRRRTCNNAMSPSSKACTTSSASSPSPVFVIRLFCSSQSAIVKNLFVSRRCFLKYKILVLLRSGWEQSRALSNFTGSNCPVLSKCNIITSMRILILQYYLLLVYVVLFYFSNFIFDLHFSLSFARYLRKQLCVRPLPGFISEHSRFLSPTQDSGMLDLGLF